jgi:DNA-binding winged helix-turn-helix (wHTH) protein
LNESLAGSEIFLECEAALKVRFGDVRFDGEARQVSRQQDAVHLSGKAFELLKLLLERRPAALSKAAIQEYLWPDTFVSEANLPTLVTEIRDAIGDDARQARFVRTVHGFGYAFSGDVVDESGTADGALTHCWLWSEMGRLSLTEGVNVLGRGDDARVVLESSTVSRHHARISVNGNVAIIEDLESKNGTYVGDERVVAPRPLQEGDRIRIGAFLLTFHRPDPNASTSTQTVR